MRRFDLYWLFVWFSKFNIRLGHAVIYFDSRQDAEKARTNMNQGQIDGNVIEVHMIYPQSLRRPNRRSCTCVFAYGLIFCSRFSQTRRKRLQNTRGRSRKRKTSTPLQRWTGASLRISITSPFPFPLSCASFSIPVAVTSCSWAKEELQQQGQKGRRSGSSSVKAL